MNRRTSLHCGCDCHDRKPCGEGAAGDAQIAHCLIYQYDGFYGFAEPYFIHRTLSDLVMHYRETSLFEHNDELDTTLRVPIGMVDLPSPSAGPTLIVEKVAVLTTVMVTVTVARI